MTDTTAGAVESEESLIGSDGRLNRGWLVVTFSVMAMIIGPPPVLILGFGLFVPQFHGEFGWGIEQISFGATLISGMLVLIAPLQGYLTDRLGCRTMILASIPLFGAGVFAMQFLGPNIGWFYLASILVPLAGIGLWPLTYMKMTSTWFDRRLGLALGTLNLGNGLGGAIMPLFLGLMFAAYGWRAAYLALGLLNLFVAWPLAALMLRERQVPAGAPITHDIVDAEFGLTFGEAIRTRAFAFLAIGFAVIGMLSTGFLVHQFSILREAGLSATTATALQALVGLASIVGQLGIGWCMDRVAAGRVVAAMLAAIALAASIFAYGVTAAIAPVCVILIGFMIGAEMNILGFMTKRYFGERAFGKLYGIAFACFSAGGAGGAQLFAFSRSHLGSYAPGLIATAALSLAAAGLFLFLPRYRYGAGNSSLVAH